jgi:hypothetical protein
MVYPQPYQPPEDGLPPQEVRFHSVRVEPWPEDARRVRVHLDVTPFLQRPNIEVVIANEAGDEVASITIIESIDAHMVFTMHIRGNQTEGMFSLAASLSYPELGAVDQKSINFKIS